MVNYTFCPCEVDCKFVLPTRHPLFKILFRAGESVFEAPLRNFRRGPCSSATKGTRTTTNIRDPKGKGYVRNGASGN